MCNCRSDIEKRLLDHAGKQLPEGIKNLTVSLEGYAFMLGGPGIDMKNVMPIRIEYAEPIKKKPGEFKDRKKTMSMHGNYCMFCGEKYPKADDEAAQG